MELTDSFTVDVAPAQLWEVLTDVERISPCIPGFQLEAASHPEYRGRMKVKVGAIAMRYDAVIEFVERDDESHRAVLSIRAKERNGPGDVSATVTSTLRGEGERTIAEMVTDVQVTGRVAQFGRGILADVSSSLMGDFVECLDRRLLNAREDEPAADGAAAGRPPASTAGPEPVAAVDLGAATARAVARRSAPVVIVGVVCAAVVAWLLGR